MDWGIEDIDCGKEKSFVNSDSYINLAFENLKVDTGINNQFDGIPLPTKDAATSSTKCNFVENFRTCTDNFQTNEKSSLQLIIQGSEILNYQGTIHSADDVAPYWKKDSRMWLWKSVRCIRRKNKAKCSVMRSLPKNAKQQKPNKTVLNKIEAS